jgi:hypothetical protein
VACRFLNLREEQIGGVLRTFGPQGEEVIGGWRKLHSEEPHNLYSSPNVGVLKSRRMNCVRRAALIGENINAFTFLVGEPEGRRQLGRRSHRWENNINPLKPSGYYIYIYIYIHTYIHMYLWISYGSHNKHKFFLRWALSWSLKVLPVSSELNLYIYIYIYIYII